MQTIKTVELSLKDGQMVALDMSEHLVDQIITAFNLKSFEEISEEHVKRYLASGMKRALEMCEGADGLYILDQAI